MRSMPVLAVCLVLVGGCFDEGGESSQEAAALTTAAGLIAFQDIFNNLETDPAAAGEALLEFMKTPVAADNLISPPFDMSALDAARVNASPATPVPDCLKKSGKPSCDQFSTIGACEAGGFTFAGHASRRCNDCTSPTGFCSYGFTFFPLTFTTEKFSLEVFVQGGWAGTASQVLPSLSASYELHSGPTTSAGALNVCACSALTIQRSNTVNGKPRKLVNSSFLVTASASSGVAARCALVDFDGAGHPLVTNSCECATGAACPVYNVTPDVCGNGICDVDLGEEVSCPRDCATGSATCGDGLCNNGETRLTCTPDCGEQPAVCGNAMCEIGETEASCAQDCVNP